MVVPSGIYLLLEYPCNIITTLISYKLELPLRHKAAYVLSLYLCPFLSDFFVHVDNFIMQ
jgi:hypothetical protein